MRAIRDFGGEKEIAGILADFDKEKITIAFPGENDGEEDVCGELALKDLSLIHILIIMRHTLDGTISRSFSIIIPELISRIPAGQRILFRPEESADRYLT